MAKKITTFLMAALLIFTLVGCGNNSQQAESNSTQGDTAENTLNDTYGTEATAEIAETDTSQSVEFEKTENNSKTLVVYFSWSTSGNTEKMATYIQSQTGADILELHPANPSEYGLGAVTADKRTGEFGTAYGIPADMAILVPKYAMSLSAGMTAYTGAVTLVQLSVATIGDLNPVSYHIGISIIKDVLNAVQTLKQKPDDLTAWGTIFYGASISTSGRLGLGKEENYAYDIYEVEFVPEILFDATYRKSLTTIFPRFLKAMSVYHEEHIKRYFRDAFGFEESIENSVKKLIDLFTELGIDMYFDGDFTEDKISKIDIGSIFSENEIADILRDCLRTKKK